jgi:hypothetical protein
MFRPMDPAERVLPHFRAPRRALADNSRRLRRAAVLWNPTSPAAAQAVGETQTAAQTLGLQLQSLAVRPSEELRLLREAGRAGGFGLVVGVDRVGQAEALRRHGADIVVADLADLLDR